MRGASASRWSVFGLGAWIVDKMSVTPCVVVVVWFADVVEDRRGGLKGGMAAPAKCSSLGTYLPKAVRGHLGSNIKHREGAMSASLVLAALSCPWRLDGAALALSTLSGLAPFRHVPALYLRRYPQPTAWHSSVRLHRACR